MRAALERAGYLALGAIYMAMGVVSARIALLGARDRDHGVLGAFRFLLDRPLGPWMLGAVVAGLAGIAAAHLTQAARGPGGPFQRIGLAVNGFGYGVLAWTAARLLLHIGRASAGVALEREGVSWLLGESWGAAALELVGAGVAAGGLWEIGQGIAGRLPLLPLRRGPVPRGLRRALSAVARFGLVARGATLAALGYFLIRAAEELDPAAVRNVGGVLDAFAHTALGPAFMAVIGAGLAAYGLYLWMRSALLS